MPVHLVLDIETIPDPELPRQDESERVPVADFVRGAKVLLPELEEADLRPAYSGIRAKLAQADGGTGRPKETADFVIERDPRMPCLIHMIGIESPGLTAAWSLAKEVAGMVRETLS
jgi:L-2-hydroxyglutarate oxidase LhgO